MDSNKNNIYVLKNGKNLITFVIKIVLRCMPLCNVILCHCL